MKNNHDDVWLFRKQIRSKYNGILEITRVDGKKLLNSQRANYSYGALEQVLDLGLGQVKADRAAPVLVLGMGGGSVFDLLRKKYNYYGKITAVELDPVVIEIAQKEFNIAQHEPLQVICKDAAEYVQESKGKFGLIIVDLFIDLEVPDNFFCVDFWKRLATNLGKEGKLLFNAGINLSHDSQVDQLISETNSFLEFQRRDEVYGSNTLLIGYRID